MSLIDLASLVLAPTATKEGKVYSAIPDTGDGDMTFTRGSAATRVNSEGLIEKERGNLLLQSNSFSNAVWVDDAGGCTRTSGQSGYDGTNDAWLLTQNSDGYDNVVQSVSSSGVNTYSIYAKGSSTAFTLRIANTGDRVLFNLTTGSVASTFGSNLVDYGMTDIGGGWYRCYLTANATITDLNIYPYFNSTTATSVTIQDAMLNEGLVAQPYIETTTTAVYEGITDDVPRVDYSGGGCPSLLLEGQRSNLIPNSEYLDGWTGTSTATITTNYTTSPEGVNNATRLQFAASSNLRHEQIIAGAYESQSITVSVYAKSLTGNDQDFRLKCTHANVLDYFSNDLTATNEWQRFEFTQAFGSSTGTGIVTGIFQATDNLAKDIAFYGFQVEASASYATSLIPTYGTSTTRVADSCSKTGISELIGQTEGTLFYEFEQDYTSAVNGFASLSDGSSTNRITVNTLGVSLTEFTFSIAMNYSGSGTVLMDSDITYNDKHKAVVVYSGTTAKLFIDGSQVDTNTTTGFGNYDRFIIGQNQGGGSAQEQREFYNAVLFPTALTDDECIALTK